MLVRAQAPLLRAVRGRWFQEQIVARDGNLIAITGLNSHSDIFDHIEQFQYYQEAPGKVTLRLVPKPSFADTERAHILGEIQTKVRDQIEIDIAILPEIPRTDRGKYRFLVQKLPVRDQARYAQTLPNSNG